MHINDTEVGRAFTYFLTAYYFHWTPEETDRVEYYTLETLLHQLPLWIKKINEVKTNG